MTENGFRINEEFEARPTVQRKNINKKGFPPLFKGVAVLLLIAVIGIVFCATIPVCKITKLESCVITSSDESAQTNYYNDKGLIEKKVYTYMGTENGYTICTYDRKGNILKEESTYQGTLTDINTYIYTNGLLTRTESKDTSGKLLGASDLQYNSDGTLAMKISYDEENKPSIQYNYSYIAGRLVKESVLYLANNYSEEVIYTYEGSFMTNEVRRSDRTERVINYTYDNRGNVLTKNVKNGEYSIYKYNYKTVRVPVFKKK